MPPILNVNDTFPSTKKTNYRWVAPLGISSGPPCVPIYVASSSNDRTFVAFPKLNKKFQDPVWAPDPGVSPQNAKFSGSGEHWWSVHALNKGLREPDGLSFDFKFSKNAGSRASFMLHLFDCFIDPQEPGWLHFELSVGRGEPIVV